VCCGENKRERDEKERWAVGWIGFQVELTPQAQLSMEYEKVVRLG
jgi:hypothetical protein